MRELTEREVARLTESRHISNYRDSIRECLEKCQPLLCPLDSSVDVGEGWAILSIDRGDIRLTIDTKHEYVCFGTKNYCLYRVQCSTNACAAERELDVTRKHLLLLGKACEIGEMIEIVYSDTYWEEV